MKIIAAVLAVMNRHRNEIPDSKLPHKSSGLVNFLRGPDTD